jgi:hypothetical protein
MNARLMELIIINIGLQRGIISPGCLPFWSSWPSSRPYDIADLRVAGRHGQYRPVTESLPDDITRGEQLGQSLTKGP